VTTVRAALLVLVAFVAVSTPARAATTASVSIGDVSIVEGGAKNRTAYLPVTLNVPATTTVTVDYHVIGGTATRGVDDNVLGGRLTFSPLPSGLTPVTRYVAVSVRPDIVAEGDESVIVRLSNPTGGYALGRADGTATIIDDDPATAQLSIGDATIVEGDSGMRVLRFPVTLDSPSSTAVFVSWTTTSVTATCATVTNRRPTIAGQDCGVLMQLASNNVVRPLFPTAPPPPRTGIPGPTGVSKHIDFAIFPDTMAEGDEQFTVTIHSTDATVLRAVATGTIIDDD
jgi:hypothetical protein